MANKKVYIIHRWGGNSNERWLVWLGNQLKTIGYEVTIPDMPNSETPKIEEWVGYLQKLIPTPDENTFLVGHSVGCQAIIRYLEKLENIKVGGAVFVAGWFNLTGLESNKEKEIAKPWIETPINFEKVKSAASNFMAILSDNDPYVPLSETKKIFEEKLGAKVVIEKNKGHFTEGDDVFELPEVVRSIEKLAK
ncbi:MAG: alpha/beta hydrolase [Candidatus Moranbacteria bacterium]|nr:alpha/beta hydrolase [Candidatus Moranbacteria bacterium]